MTHDTLLRINGFDTAIARVESFKLGTIDHGILQFFVSLDFKGSGQGFGGYAMDAPNPNRKENFTRIGSVFGTECILRLLRCFNVEDISEIKGKPCLALYKIPYEPYQSKIVGIAPLPCDKGDPFIIEECADFCKLLKTESNKGGVQK